jgi:gamma-glutamyl-gamma-aminobutyrate hydrolase PuuD
LKIGISQRILYNKGRAYDALEHGWYSYLKEHVLFPIPNTLEQDFELTATNLDAFIISGGDDSTIRRTVEIKYATAFMQRKKPVLGICHGAFLITDLLGGQVIETENHTDTEHYVNYITERKLVNSYHSLAIKKLQTSATPLCTDDSGNIEAYIDGNLTGIVWHPERMDQPWIPKEIENLFFKKELK